MPQPPKGKSSPESRRPPPPDRTSAVVAVGLVSLAALGVLTIFSGPLMALVDPIGTPTGTPTGTEPAAQPEGSPPAGTNLGRGDGGAHS